MQKKCKNCGEVKMLAEFVKHKRYKDGYYSQCKVCTYEKEKAWRLANQEKKREIRTRYREKNREKIREMDREYYRENHEKRLETAKKSQAKYHATEKGKANLKKHNILCRKRNPEAARARSLLSNAVCEGKVIRPDKCSLCSDDQFVIEAHHPDYSKPYEVVWLCRSCHGFVHRKVHAKRLSEEISKENATVCSHDESMRGELEEAPPPS